MDNRSLTLPTPGGSRWVPGGSRTHPRGTLRRVVSRWVPVGPYPEGVGPTHGTHPAGLWAATRTTKNQPGGSHPTGTHLEDHSA